MKKKQRVVCLIMAAILPASLLADDTGAAILRSNGEVLVNGNRVAATVTLFPGDTVHIQPNSAARIEVTGSTMDVNSETLLQFESDEIHLDHGSVSVNTSRALKVRVGCLTVTPVDVDWTKYDVSDTNGKVIVAATKRDVNIDSHGGNLRAMKTGNSGRITVREGEQKSREEKCGGADVKDGIAAEGPIFNSLYLKIPAAALIVGGTACLLACFGDDPISPSAPTNSKR